MKNDKETGTTERLNAAVPIIALICVLSLAVMVFALSRGGKTVIGEFIPPSFDSAACDGSPQVDDPSWTRIWQDGMDFSAHICGNVTVSGSSADVYFYNDTANSVYMKLRVCNADGDILGETGLLKPDQYVKSVTLETAPSDGAEIKLKIMTYVPETYYSAGAVTLNTVVSVTD